MRVTIRRADERHREEINALVHNAQIGDSIEGPVRDYWFVRDKGRIIACCGLEMCDATSAILVSIVVDKPYRKQGIGSQLVQYRLAVARARGATSAALVTSIRKLHHYRRLGFEICKRAQLPAQFRDYWMFTSPRYKKFMVMTRTL